MSFPVNSTSVQTSAIKRTLACLQRAEIERVIGYAGVFVCKKIIGSSSWSQHSWGNAADIFPKGGGPTQERLRAIANAVVYHATHRTKANRFRKLDVAEVIDHDGRRIWTPGAGWHPYGGTTGAHIHVSGAPLKTGVPPCA